MKRIDVWNEAVKEGYVDFRNSDADNLNLLMRRTTKVQQIKRNGVYVETAGKKIWFKDETTVFHIGEEVYVRFDPAHLQEVKVYDKNTDKLLYTYPCAEYLNLPFVGAEQEDIQTLMRSQANTKKAVKAQLKEYKKFDAVSLLKAELLRAEQNSAGYEIAKPASFTPIIANELMVSNLNITKIEFADIKKMNDVLEKTKGA